MQKLKGTTYKGPKPLILKQTLPNVKFASSISSKKSLFPTLNQAKIQDVTQQIESEGRKLTGALKGTQPVIQGDPRYAEFYNFNKFGQLSTNINVNDPNVQKTVLQKMVDNGTLPKDVLDKLKPQAGWLERVFNAFSLIDPYEWIGTIWDAAVTQPVSKFKENIKTGKIDTQQGNLEQGLENLLAMPRFVANVVTKLGDDLDGIFGDGYRDQYERWRVIDQSLRDVKNVNDIIKSYAPNNPQLKQVSDLLQPVVDIAESDVDLPVIGKQKVRGIADFAVSFATNLLIDPFTVLSKLGVLKPMTRQFTIFQSAKSPKFLAGIEGLADKLIGLVQKEHPTNWVLYLDDGIKKLPGLNGSSILNAINRGGDLVTQTNQAKQAITNALLTYHNGITITPEELIKVITNNPQRWVKPGQTINDVLNPKNIKSIINKFNSAPESSISAQLSKEGDEILTTLSKKYNELPKNADTFEMEITKLVEEPNVKMRSLIKENPDLLYNSSKDIFDPNGRFVIKNAAQQQTTNVLKELYSSPVKKLQNLLAGPQGIITEAIARLRGIDINEAPALRAVVKQQADMFPYVQEVVKRGRDMKMGDVFTRMNELYTKTNIQTAVKFFMDYADKAGIKLSAGAISALTKNPLNALPMLIENQTAFSKFFKKFPIVKEMVDSYVEGNSIINQLRQMYEFPGYNSPINYFPRQFSGNNTMVPFYGLERVTTQGNTFLDAQAYFYEKGGEGFMFNPLSTLRQQYKDAVDMLALGNMAKQNLNYAMNSGSIIATSKPLMSAIASNKELDHKVAQIYFDNLLTNINSYAYVVEKSQILESLKNLGLNVKMEKGILKLVDKSGLDKLLTQDLVLFQSKIADIFKNNGLLLNIMRAKPGFDDEAFEVIHKVVLSGIEQNQKLSDLWSLLPKSYARVFDAAYLGDLPIQGWEDVKTFKAMIDEYGTDGLNTLLKDPQNFIDLQKQLGIVDSVTERNLTKLFRQMDLIEKDQTEKSMKDMFGQPDGNDIKKAEKAVLEGETANASGDFKWTSEQSLQNRLSKVAGDKNFRLNLEKYYDNSMNTIRKLLTQYSPSLPFTSAFGNTMMDWLLHGVDSLGSAKANHDLTRKIVGEMRAEELAEITSKGMKTQGTAMTAKMFNKIASIPDEVITSDALEAIRKVSPEDAAVLEAYRLTNDYKYSTTLNDFASDFAEVGLSHNGYRGYYAPGADKGLGAQINKIVNADPFAFLYLNRYTDTYYKTSVMRNMIKRYGNIDDAVREFNNFFKTYKDLSPLERMFARRVAMFYLFQRNNFVNYFKALGTKQGVIKRTQLFFKFVQALQSPELKEEFKKLPADDWRKNTLWIGNPDWFALGGNTSLEAALQFGRIFSFMGGDLKSTTQALAKNLNMPLSFALAVFTNSDPRTGQKIDTLSDPYIRNSVQGYEKVTNRFMISVLKTLPKEVQNKIGFVETLDNNTKEPVYTLDPYINYHLTRHVPIPLFNQVTKMGSNPDTDITDYMYLFTAIRQQGQADLLKLRATAQIADSARTEKLMNMYNLGQSIETFSMQPLQKMTAGLPMSVEQYNKAQEFSTSPLTYKDFNIQYTNTQKLQKLFKKQFKAKKIVLKPISSKKLFSDINKLY